MKIDVKDGFFEISVDKKYRSCSDSRTVTGGIDGIDCHKGEIGA